ncbi:amidohydrolase [Dokdonia sinensis]|uniref:Amidohydrolase n=1 Tax=Dokdonia sinensis TaxID=2479847 RepID=A0A3M0GIA7_9FLAO|nr:amidohydrolase family protein [Dokdonia sinensis]RMB64018.1 amidohydrolase [Dokdonia sinensis]
MLFKQLSFIGLLLCSLTFYAQDYFPKNDGVQSKNNNYTVFKNATIHTSPTETIKKGTLVVRDGKVVSVGKNVNAPANAIVIDLDGKSIYPSFIDIYSDFGIEKPKRPSGGGRTAQYEGSREGYYWNDHIRAEQEALGSFKYDSKKAKEYVAAGFAVVNTHLHDGIARGTGMLVALNTEGDDASRILDASSGNHFSFDKSVTSRQSYPGSIMGKTALLRQVYHDADWYGKGNVPTKDLTLEAVNKNKDMVQIFEGSGLYDALRIDKIGDEFGVNYLIVGGGDEYKRIDEVKALNRTFILPLKFPDAYDMENPYNASYVSLEDMRGWNQAPTNPKVLTDNNVNFALTTFSHKSPKDFKDHLMKAIKYGLSKEKALSALTTIPAQLIGQSDKVGSLKDGAWANFMITSGDIFDKDTDVYEHWVQGNKTVLKDMSIKNIDGKYNVTVAGKTYELTVENSMEKKPKATLKKGEDKVPSEFSYSDGWMNLTFADGDKQFTRLVSNVSDGLSGKAILPSGAEQSFAASRTGDAKEDKEDDDKDKEEKEITVMPMTYPNIAFGFKEKPKQEDMLFKNVTLWTNEAEGIIENTDVLVKDGKISAIGSNLKAGRATVIDGTGKHLTAGIIDEHSHIAAFSINEGGQNSSAEVRMADAVDPDDIDIYRNLAGGVTAIQLLHGSANPIGGQSAVMKLKWGSSIDDMVLEDKKFIKFALGENVKQSNWESYSRFPQTRMGVQQLFVDYFQRAKEYEDKKKSGQPYRVDEELETIVDILNQERAISCHSYVQSEINMLMKVAESFNFRVNTFTHILEGYKVADKMKEHGVGASTFSDWWAYKYEVNDAIPYNAAIMHKEGVTVAINSDDGEMSRRLNQEAAKSVKYGDVSEEDAWKFVTLNPAKLLHMDDKVGSVKVGKDADLVLWTDNPLSIKARAEKTIIEGTVYFDMERDAQMREEIEQEKNKLTTMMLAEKNKGLKVTEPKKKDKQHLHCDTLETIH